MYHRYKLVIIEIIALYFLIYLLEVSADATRNTTKVRRRIKTTTVPTISTSQYVHQKTDQIAVPVAYAIEDRHLWRKPQVFEMNDRIEPESMMKPALDYHTFYPPTARPDQSTASTLQYFGTKGYYDNLTRNQSYADGSHPLYETPKENKKIKLRTSNNQRRKHNTEASVTESDEDNENEKVHTKHQKVKPIVTEYDDYDDEEHPAVVAESNKYYKDSKGSESNEFREKKYTPDYSSFRQENPNSESKQTEEKNEADYRNPIVYDEENNRYRYLSDILGISQFDKEIKSKRDDKDVDISALIEDATNQYVNRRRPKYKLVRVYEDDSSEEDQTAVRSKLLTRRSDTDAPLYNARAYSDQGEESRNEPVQLTKQEDNRPQGTTHEETKHKKPKKPKKTAHKKGGGEKHNSDHHTKHGEHGEKGYKGHHKHEKSEKGHHDKEGHKGSYEDHGGHKKKHHHEDDHFAGHKKAEKGEKDAEYSEHGKHEKGHNTKGEHNIHKKDEYEKKHEFYDEYHEGGGDEKHGAYHHEHEGHKGGHYKLAHHNSDHDHNKKGHKGKKHHGDHYKDEHGYEDAAGHNDHYGHKSDYGKDEKHEGGKKWGYKKGKR